MRSKTEALIVGAGPTGLVLAYELARRQVPFRLIDRAPERSKTSKAIAVQARSLEMFDLMGLGADQLLPRGHGVTGGDIFDQSRTHRIVHIDFSELPSRYRQMFLLPQWETEQFIEDGLKRLGGSVERGSELLGYKQNDGAVSAEVRRSDGETETIEARWLVGCDGGHSRVREIAGISFEGSTYANVFALADLHIDGKLDQSQFQVFTHEEGPLAIFPLGEGRYRIVADNPPPTFSDNPSLGDCQALVDERGPAGLRLRDPVWMSRARIHRRSAGHLRSGRVFLAGDAGNIHSPAGGQGMNTGMQDAFNLGWKLALAVQGQASDLLLDSYEQERQPVEDAVVRASDFITRMVTLKSPATRFIRDHIAPIVTGLAPVRERIGENLAELTVHYRSSRIVDNTAVRGDGPYAGDHALDIQLRQPQGPLFSHFGHGGHLALIFGASGQLADNLRSWFGSWLQVVAQPLGPSEGPNGRPVEYAAEPAFYLVRPDGFVGLRCPADDGVLERVQAYWGRLTGRAESSGTQRAA